MNKTLAWRMHMRTLFVFAVLATLACAVPPQEDPVETCRIPVRFLTDHPQDVFGTVLGLAQDAIASAVTEEREGGLVPAEELVSLLKKDVAPASWEAPGASLEIAEGTLVSVARRSVQAELSTWLERARLRHSRRMLLEAALVVVPFDRWARVQPRELLEGATLLKSARLSAVSGQRVVAQDLTQQSYIRDYDVQISTGQAGLDPVVDVLNTGVRIELRPWLSPDADQVIFEIRSEAASLEALEDKTLKALRQEAPALPAGVTPGGAVGPTLLTPWEGHLHLPHTTFDRIRGEVAARMGETVVAAAASRPDGILALLLTPTLEAGKLAPGPAPSPTTLYEVDALAAPIPDWPGPHVELVSPQRGGGGPLTGATFTLDEPREGYGLEKIKSEIQSVFEPARPKDQESPVQSFGWRTLAVRGAASVQEAVLQRLREAYQREAKMLTTEAVVLLFPAGSRGELAKQMAALGPGGSRASDEEMSRLLAAKGLPVKMAALLSVSGRAGQRVHVTSGRQQTYVQDFEPQVSTASTAYDPIIGIFSTGIGLDARPMPRAADGTVDVQVRAWTLSGELEDKRVSTDVSPVQCPRVTGFVWEPAIVCAPGQWTLAALESRGTGPASEEFALFVRVR